MKAVIFDLDGTLSDTIPLIVRTAQRAWADLGLDISEQEIKGHIGVPLVETGEHFLGPGRGGEYLEAYMRHYYDDDFQLKPFTGAVELLTELKQRGVKLAVATAKRRQAAAESLREIGVAHLLDAVVDCESTALHKPHAEPALHAAALLGESPGRCLFVGDSLHDLLSGHAAGMAACGVTWGAGSRGQLEQAQPEYIVDTVAGLSALLLSLAAGGKS